MADIIGNYAVSAIKLSSWPNMCTHMFCPLRRLKLHFHAPQHCGKGQLTATLPWTSSSKDMFEQDVSVSVLQEKGPGAKDIWEMLPLPHLVYR